MIVNSTLAVDSAAIPYYHLCVSYNIFSFPLAYK